MRNATGMGLLLALLGGAQAMAKDTAGEAMADLLVSNYIATACPTQVARKGTEDQAKFLTEGIEALRKQGYGKAELAKAAALPPEDISAAMQKRMETRGVDIADVAALCAYGAKMAGTDDPVGQFLVKK